MLFQYSHLFKNLVIFTFVILFSGCSAFRPQMSSISNYKTYTLTEDEQRDIKCKVILTSGLNEQKLPINNISEYILDSETPLCIFVRFFNLYRTEYFVCVNMYSEDGKLFDQYNSVFKPSKISSDISFTGKYLSSLVKPGNIKIELKINNVKVDESVLLFKKKTQPTTTQP
jgi:hypothetical protein